jgi:hypothetical protein
MSDSDLTSYLPVAAFFAVTSLILIIFSIRSIQNEPPAHVHQIWYLFSLALCVASIVYALIPSVVPGLNDPSTFHPAGLHEKIEKIILDESINVNGEFGLIGIMAAVLVLPQIMSFLLAGLFGCGAFPLFVERISVTATLSLVKFFSVMSGLTAAQVIYFIIQRPIGIPRLYPIFSAVSALITISLSFFPWQGTIGSNEYKDNRFPNLSLYQ